ncbi:hypothetical protein J8J14_05565 [Roseomonas sp. SSH11]|uniref:Lipoprotein n=1 Tax=Pararoseomonas baculiformis TaxID=2820812 RepID=A0ABS4AB68_9PROT|nr:hypothetical protein [Pararoseomonas baculiformis]MBP0444241.1 hypothetical protein [Pararoseomonas baculiformis]
MRSPALFLPLLLAALPGCEAVVPVAAANGVSLMLTGRAVPDLMVSGLSGRDCSVAYLDAGERYCRPESQPQAQPYCTRSLGSVDCWNGPVPGNPPPAGVAQARPGEPAPPWPARAL